MNERFNIELFVEDFKKFRKENTLSQSEFASKLGLKTHTLISKIETNKIYPSQDIVSAFCSISSYSENKYWEMKKEEIPFAFLKGNVKGILSKNIEKLCKNIATQEYLILLKKHYYEK